MFYTCGPNEAMVVSGCGRSPPLLIAGGRVFVFPCIQQIQRISLNTLTLNVKSDKVYTRHGVPISVTGIAQVKIQGQNKEMLATACQMFMGKSESEIAQIALETLEGHQRAIIAHLTVEEIYQDRKKFSEQVFKVASSDLVNMGIGVVSYTLKDVHDDQEAHAMQEKVSAQYKNEIEMAKAQRDFELKKAAYDIEVNTKKAESEMAYQLQVAKTKQRIEEEKMQVQVVERTQQITLQEQEITRREKELEAKVRKPAEAERYRIEKIAEAERLQLIMEAEAEAESIRMRGEAEAFALEAKGRAEAEQMAKKAEAFKQYKEGAMVDMLLEKLPLMAEEISKPLCAAQKVTMVSSGGSEVGAAKLTGEVLDIMTRLPSTVEKLTGVNISQSFTPVDSGIASFKTKVHSSQMHVNPPEVHY
ncbi:flotillin-1-like protein [Labeo rohita]|uniref:Flotillin n=1 Tax=Labeo rohita TaxID=84645 RepID=A0A498LJ30_LABRO|nr:flotillin-1-like protein [Labeo rohita]